MKCIQHSALILLFFFLELLGVYSKGLSTSPNQDFEIKNKSYKEVLHSIYKIQVVLLYAKYQ